jgi:hypothetical protein
MREVDEVFESLRGSAFADFVCGTSSASTS